MNTPPIPTPTSTPTPPPSGTSIPPNDEYFAKLRGLKAIMAEEAWAKNADASSPYVWPPNQTSPFRVAVLGSGCEIARSDSAVTLHEDLQPIGDGRTGINTDLNSDTTGSGAKGAIDGGGHGTHVVGTITANANNDHKGVVGVTWRAEIVCIKVLRDTGGGSYLSIEEGIRRAIKIGVDEPTARVRVINASLGAPIWFTNIEAAIRDFVLQDEIGGLFVAARGNNGTFHQFWPASHSAEAWVIETGKKEDDMPADSLWRRGEKYMVHHPNNCSTSGAGANAVHLSSRMFEFGCFFGYLEDMNLRARG